MIKNLSSMNYEFVIVIFFYLLMSISFTSCRPPEIVVDDERVKVTSVIPANIAEDIISRHTGRGWVENPYLDGYYWAKDSKTVWQEPVKKYINFNEMIMTSGTGNCIHVHIKWMEEWDPKTDRKTWYFYKEICTRIKEERNKIIDAFLALGASWQRGIFD